MARLSRQDSIEKSGRRLPERNGQLVHAKPVQCHDAEPAESISPGKGNKLSKSCEMTPTQLPGASSEKAYNKAQNSAKASQQMRARRCLKPLADDNTLLRPAFEAEPRRRWRASAALTKARPVEQISQDIPKPDEKSHAEPKEPGSVQNLDWYGNDENKRTTELEGILHTSTSDIESDEEDALPIKPSRTPRTLSKALKKLDIFESQKGDLTPPQHRGSTDDETSNDSTLHIQAVLPTRDPDTTEPPHATSTPPASPSKSRLKSPSKTAKHIPLAPHNRPSLDAFWSVDEVNSWNDQHSPKKVLKSPRKNPLLLFTQPTQRPLPAIDWSDREQESDGEYVPLYKKRLNETSSQHTTSSPGKVNKTEALEQPSADARTAARRLANAKKLFDATKHETADKFLKELDDTITEGEISRLTASTGGVKLVWSKKLNSTAGRAHWKRERVYASASASAGNAVSERHVASIEIAEKVIDDEGRLRNVLAHEFCHLTNFMISKMTKEPHGASFKMWAAKVTSAFAHVGVEVTTKHSYEISYKYAWVCAGDISSRGPPGAGGVGIWDDDGCGTTYQRHSKSIDPALQRCGNCKGRLEQVRPIPRGANSLQASQKTSQGKVPQDKRELGAAKAKSGYQAFVSEQYKIVKAELGPNSPMKEVMGEIGRRYRAQKRALPEMPKSQRAIEVIDLEEESSESSSPNNQVDEVARKLDFLEL